MTATTVSTAATTSMTGTWLGRNRLSKIHRQRLGRGAEGSALAVVSLEALDALGR